MHGLVAVDKNKKVLRPSIIWCDSRAVEIGDRAFDKLGKDFCLHHLLNSPGNFTASKLAWVRENEPDCLQQDRQSHAARRLPGHEADRGYKNIIHRPVGRDILGLHEER